MLASPYEAGFLFYVILSLEPFRGMVLLNFLYPVRFVVKLVYYYWAVNQLLEGFNPVKTMDVVRRFVPMRLCL